MQKLLAQATQINVTAGGQYTNVTGYTFSKILSFVIQGIFVVAGLIAFILLVVGGIRWITSGGDKEKTAKAQSTIPAAVVGLLIVFAAWAIIRLVEAVFGVNIINVTVPTIWQQPA